jgi:hypothetical protein
MLPSDSLSREELIRAFKDLAGLEDLCDDQMVFIQADADEGEGISILTLLDIIKDNFGDRSLDQIYIATSELIEVDDEDNEIDDEGPIICLFLIEKDNNIKPNSRNGNPPSVN